MTDIDFSVPATIFARQATDLPSEGEYEPIEFDTTAEAIRHAMEEIEGGRDLYISSATTRLDREQISRAYQDGAFPLERKAR
jgi:hypothetical protein